MKNFAVICLFAVTAVLFVQEISSDDGFRYDEVHDVAKRQSWDAFKDKHVVDDNRPIPKDDNYWKGKAWERLGGSRSFNTFILTSPAELFSSFRLRKKCSNKLLKNYVKSDEKFYVVDVELNEATGKYSANRLGKMYICVTLDGKGFPIHLQGTESK